MLLYSSDLMIKLDFSEISFCIVDLKVIILRTQNEEAYCLQEAKRFGRPASRIAQLVRASDC